MLNKSLNTYLGTTISKSLEWSSNVRLLHKKANQRLYFVRTLKKFRVDNTIIALFYKSLIQSIISYNLICYFGNATKIEEKKLNQPRKIVQRLLGTDLPSLDDIYHERVLSKLRQIMQDPTHPLNDQFSCNRSGIHLYNAQVRRSVPQF